MPRTFCTTGHVFRIRPVSHPSINVPHGDPTWLILHRLGSTFRRAEFGDSDLRVGSALRFLFWGSKSLLEIILCNYVAKKKHFGLGRIRPRHLLSEESRFGYPRALSACNAGIVPKDSYLGIRTTFVLLASRPGVRKPQVQTVARHDRQINFVNIETLETQLSSTVELYRMSVFKPG